jgi:hypothetical protein
VSRIEIRPGPSGAEQGEGNDGDPIRTAVGLLAGADHDHVEEGAEEGVSAGYARSHRPTREERLDADVQESRRERRVGDSSSGSSSTTRRT